MTCVRLVVLALTLVLSGAEIAAQLPKPTNATPTYGQLVSAGYDFLKEGKSREAYAAAMMAASQDPKRFESYALAAAVLHVQGANREARPLIQRALSLGPPSKKPALQELAARIDREIKLASTAALGKQPTGSAASTVPSPTAKSTSKMRVKIGTSSVGYVNVRREPRTTSDILGRVKAGETYTASQVTNGWYRLEGKGWVAGRYVIVE
jgi:hypothetical protein